VCPHRAWQRTTDNEPPAATLRVPETRAEQQSRRPKRATSGRNPLAILRLRFGPSRGADDETLGVRNEGGPGSFLGVVGSSSWAGDRATEVSREHGPIRPGQRRKTDWRLRHLGRKRTEDEYCRPTLLMPTLNLYGMMSQRRVGLVILFNLSLPLVRLLWCVLQKRETTSVLG
jgi:hypothetical protein